LAAYNTVAQPTNITTTHCHPLPLPLSLQPPTGNLVTNRSWEHFWLNEGWTVFLERKILGRLYGEQVGGANASCLDGQARAVGSLCGQISQLASHMVAQNPFSSWSDVNGLPAG